MENLIDTKIAAVVLAGGKGSRMQADLPKVLHSIIDRPMIFYTLENLNKLGVSDIYVVVGHQSETVKTSISSKFNCQFAHQPEPMGTAHAVECALKNIDDQAKTVLVMNGDDSAFYKIPTLRKFIEYHYSGRCPVSMVTLNLVRERKLGRVVRDGGGQFEKIIEAERVNDQGVVSDEINCGLYLFDFEWLRGNIKKIKLSDKGEYYITDLFNLAKKEGSCVNLFNLENEDEWVGVNTPDELALANERMKEKLAKGE